MTEGEFLDYMDTVPTIVLNTKVLSDIWERYRETPMFTTMDMTEYLTMVGRLHAIHTNDGLIFRIMKPYMDDEKWYSGLLTEDD